MTEEFYEIDGDDVFRVRVFDFGSPGPMRGLLRERVGRVQSIRTDKSLPWRSAWPLRAWRWTRSAAGAAGRWLWFGIWQRRYSVVDLVTWPPMGSLAFREYGFAAGIVTVIVVAAIVGWIEGKVNNGKDRG